MQPDQTPISKHRQESASSAIPVLLIGTAGSSRGVLRGILGFPRWKTYETLTCHEAIGLLDRLPIGVAICDTEIQDGKWQLLLAEFQSRERPPNLIVSSRLADERLWAEVLNLGGYDVLAQPFDRGEVLRVTHRAWIEWRQERSSLRMGAGL